MTNEDDVIGCVSTLVAVFVVLPAKIVAEAFIVQTMWGWFVVPLGVPALGFWHAAGFSVLWTYLSPKYSIYHDASDESELDYWRRIAKVWLGMAFYLVLGFIVHLLM